MMTPADFPSLAPAMPAWELLVAAWQNAQTRKMISGRFHRAIKEGSLPRNKIRRPDDIANKLGRVGYVKGICTIERAMSIRRQYEVANSAGLYNPASAQN
jgi:hypothetical protein